ncbi:hypothetical protein, partial [Siminovitchia fortis]|uniref:hypothetical protein n=1 Tax=Siminovitchia fortis TaxID=254758 RepID=UPI001642C297
RKEIITDKLGLFDSLKGMKEIVVIGDWGVKGWKNWDWGNEENEGGSEKGVRNGGSRAKRRDVCLEGWGERGKVMMEWGGLREERRKKKGDDED